MNKFKIPTTQKIKTLAVVLGLNFLLINSCTKENSSVSKVSILTNKSIYLPNEKIVVSIRNYSDSIYYFLICNGNQNPTGSIEKYENKMWSTIENISCIGIGTYWGGKILSGQELHDTIIVQSYINGTYRIHYELEKLNSKKQYEQDSIFSNLFTIE